MAKSKRQKPAVVTYARWAAHNKAVGILGPLHHTRAEARFAQKRKGYAGAPIVPVTVVVGARPTK